MVNIWDFLLQSLSLSLVAGLILIVKAIFKDKLSPRWQYGVWVLLVIRLFLPVKASKFVILPVGFYLEILKGYVEKGLSSSFSTPFVATEPSHVFPYISSAPQSITDFLFLIYISGIVAFLLYYFVSYVRLRLALKNGREISVEEKERIDENFRINGLSPIKVISVSGIDSAFICGVIKPVLVLPKNRSTDEKIILHEIMHLKHFDLLQNISWCVMRSLHWCNPFLQYVFNIIGNDMESLCDQRVLEKLHGEERRDYGNLLLDEVNKKYSRTPGTTSISNGGKNIKRRIEAIVRFKKYPKGMALVSVCIILILFVPCFFVSASVSQKNIYYPHTNYQVEKSVAYSKLNRCTTPAGAIDTYAKALVEKNGIMLLTASPTEKHEEILSSLQFGIAENDIESFTMGGNPFSIFNLRKDEKGSYYATLALGVTEKMPIEKDTDEGDTILIPIEIFEENGSFVVRETGKRKYSPMPLHEDVLHQDYYLREDAPLFCESVKEGKNGVLYSKTVATFAIDYKVTRSNDWIIPSRDSSYDKNVNLNVGFGRVSFNTDFEYTYTGEDSDKVKRTYVEYAYLPPYIYPDGRTDFFQGGSSSSDGTGFYNASVNEFSKWDGRIGIDDYDMYGFFEKRFVENYEKNYKIRFFLDEAVIDEFEVEVKASENR